MEKENKLYALSSGYILFAINFFIMAFFNFYQFSQTKSGNASDISLFQSSSLIILLILSNLFFGGIGPFIVSFWLFKEKQFLAGKMFFVYSFFWISIGIWQTIGYFFSQLDQGKIGILFLFYSVVSLVFLIISLYNNFVSVIFFGVQAILFLILGFYLLFDNFKTNNSVFLIFIGFLALIDFILSLYKSISITLIYTFKKEVNFFGKPLLKINKNKISNADYVIKDSDDKFGL